MIDQFRFLRFGTKNQVVVVGLLVAWVLLFFYACVGERGSDQFWYVAEVRAVLADTAKTNSLWPHLLLSDLNYFQERPFVHRGIIPYLIAPLATVFGPYGGWIAFNFIAVIASAALIYLTCRQLAIARGLAAGTAILYLLFPLTFWNATQPLVEIAVSLICALLIWVSTSRLTSVTKLFLLLIIAIAGHKLVTVFEPIIVLIGLAFLWQVRVGSFNRPSLTPTASSFACGVIVVVATGLALAITRISGSTLGLSFSDLVMNGTTGIGNMEAWLRTDSAPFSIKLALQKMLRNVLAYAAPNSTQIFLAPFALTSMFAVFAVARSWLHVWRFKTIENRHLLLLTYMLLSALMVYITVVLLHQNQSRYGLYILPLVLVVIAAIFEVRLTQFMTKHPLLLAGGAMGLVALCAAMSIKLHSESKVVSKQIIETRSAFSEDPDLSQTEIVFECYRGGQSLQLTYAIPELIFVHISTNFGGKQLNRLEQISGAHLLICSSQNAKAIEQSTVDVELSLLKPLPRLGEGLYLFQIVPLPS